MRRYSVIVLALLLACSLAWGDAPPMTHDQAVATVKARGIDWAAEWIADVWTATPQVTMPPLQAFVTDRDVAVRVTDRADVSVAGKLDYKLTLGPWKFEGVVPRIDPWRLAEWTGGGFLAGVLATVVFEAATGHLK